jgi:ABC-type Fe3+-hydroxamate transport system substrate-binding protein
MRIISLVPSWTETLIEAGIPLIGRTRFCLHPRDVVSSIPIVGGTKTANWDQIQSLNPDLLILDQEENPRDFSQKGIPFWASHVTDGKSLERDLRNLGERLQNLKLLEMADRAQRVNQSSPLTTPHLGEALDQMVRTPEGQEKVVYVIWKNPWMAVSAETYIGFVLKKLGFEIFSLNQDERKYPKFELLKQDDLFYLFSSEPYPFQKSRDEIRDLGVKAAIVDGEKFSWFGIRSIRFLEEALGLSGER